MTRRWVRSGALALVVLLGVALRLGLLLHWPRRLNVDEATVGLMGLHILRGEFPVFFLGHGYMGALEAYLTAVVYTLVGVSALTVKLAVFLSSCLFIVITFLVGRRMAGWTGGLLGALLAAAAPPLLPVFGNYPMLGYMEVTVVGSLVLLLTLDAIDDGRTAASRSRKLAILGFLAGLGWWINPMVLSYLAAAGVFLLLTPRLWSFAGLRMIPLFFLLGSLPYWVFNLTHAFRSFIMFRKGVQGDVGVGLRRAGALLLEIVGVRGLLADPVPMLSPAAGLAYLLLLGVLAAPLWRGIGGTEAERLASRRGTQLLMLFVAFHLVAFSVSGYAEFAADRYLFPLYSAIPVLTAMVLLEVRRWSRPLAIATLALLLLNNTLALAKTVQVYEAGRRADWWNPEPVVGFLQAEGLTRAYAPQRIAFRLTLETRERIVVADPFFSERYRPYLAWIDASPRVAYVLAAPLEPTAGQFEPSLKGIGADYRRRDFGPFSVFYDFRPPFEGDLASVPPNGWRAESQPRGSDPARAFDRDVDTAWYSEEVLRAGMWYRLDLGTVVPVSGIAVLPPQPLTGTPRGYRIEVSRDGARWDAVASVPDVGITLRWENGQPRLDGSGRVVSRFVPRPVRHIRITQTGGHAHEWWAIAELFVYGPASAPAVERPEARASLEEGIRLEDAGRLDAALAAYERAVELDPELEDAHWRTVELYRRAGLPVEGSDRERRARVFERLGRWARAVREYEALLAEEGRSGEGQYSDPLTRLLELYRRVGDAERGASVARRLRVEYTPPLPAEARFGRAVRLLGWGLEPREPSAGEVAELSYYWQALEPVPEDLTIFVHFVRDGQVRFQQDHEALGGRYPTSRWREGELVRERYRVRIPAELPPGEYEVRIGLWNPRTGKRVRVEDTALPRFGDHVRLATVRLLPPR